MVQIMPCYKSTIKTPNKKIKTLKIVQNIICNSPYLTQERLGYQKPTQEDNSHVAVKKMYIIK